MKEEDREFSDYFCGEVNVVEMQWKAKLRGYREENYSLAVENMELSQMSPYQLQRQVPSTKIQQNNGKNQED